jgi:hypothetical protein
MKASCLSVLISSLAGVAFAAQPALTIYNQNFAVVRDTVPLELKAGLNEARFAGVTMRLEPDSVMLRDPSGKHSLQIIEQNYRNDPVTQELLLSLFEGKTIEFENIIRKDNAEVREQIPGKIIRSGYLTGGGAIIEVNGQLQFRLPGQPLFPNLGDGTILKPTLHWLLRTGEPGRFDAEVSYVTGGLTWEAAYNLISPEKGNTVDLIGWITMGNDSGMTFEEARIKLMAGDVNKVPPSIRAAIYASGGGGGGGAPPVSEKSFDEYHLYTVANSTTLRDRQMKQVEFVRAEGVQSTVVYVYDGVEQNIRFSGGVNEDANYGTQCNKKVLSLREFANTEKNHLGLPLPKGRIRFYRRDDDGQLEFTGEDTIDHTPRDETVRVTTGSPFDLVGERKQTNFKDYRNRLVPGAFAVDPTTGLPIPPAIPPPSNVATNTAPPGALFDESFEIKLRNHKKERVEIRVVEHLYRYSNWEITANSDPFKKTDAQTIEFPVAVKPDEEKTITYTARYLW